MNRKLFFSLSGIFLIAILIRFIYFPDNIYFGYDQARDSYISEGILEGHFKVKGPPASFNSNLFHGAMSYYLFAPLYFISQGDPTLVSIFLRIYNALGVFLVFLISSKLFNKRAGLIASLLFAFSFEQTQYALFLSHPSLGVLTVLLYYYGLFRLFYLKDSKGLALSLVGLGLSIQSHFSLIILLPFLILSFVLFRNRLPKLSVKVIALSVILFLITISTFIISEYKYHDLLSFSSHNAGEVFQLSDLFSRTNFEVSRYISDNLIILPQNTFFGVVLLIILFSVLYYLVSKNKFSFFFLGLWFLAGLVPYLISSSKIYYYGIGGSISLLILAGFLIDKIYSNSKIWGILFLFIILFSNLYLIFTNNKEKFDQYIIVEVGLVLPQEKNAIDYIYKQANNQPFAVNAVMIPFNVKTTWDYLFNWYGNGKYHYTPVWGGDAAPGYEGVLKVENSRSTLPKKRFVIIEPTPNIPTYMISGFLKNEDYFSRVIEVKEFGNITVQTREAI